MDAVGKETVETGALVDFVEVGERLAGPDDFPGGVFHGRSVAVVEDAFDQIAGGEEILEALLILDADGLAAKLVGDAEGGDVGFTLPEDLRLGELGGLVGAEVELHALLAKPVEDGTRLGFGHLRGGVVECGLRETLLVHAGLKEQFVGDDGIIHTHAALVEDAHNGFPTAKIVGDFFCDRAGLRRDGRFGERFDMRGLVRGDAGGEPRLQAGEKIIVGEIVAPEGGIFHAGFGEGAVEIQHADETGPSAGPVGDGENRSLMRDEAGEEMVRVLPDGLGDDERGLGIEAGEDLHALFLRTDEAVLLGGFVGVGADEFKTELGDGGGEGLLHRVLRGPADFVGGWAEVAVGDE